MSNNKKRLCPKMRKSLTKSSRTRSAYSNTDLKQFQ